MNLIIGKMYLVPCANLIHRCNGKSIIVPVTGKPHRDKQLGVSKLHYHIDGRFCTRHYNRVENFKVNQNGRTNGVIVVDDEGSGSPLYEFKGIVMRWRKCKGLESGLVIPSNPTNKYFEWYQSMIGKRCKGKRCPHYGHEMYEMDGKLICPLHDLHADVRTKKIIQHPIFNP